MDAHGYGGGGEAGDFADGCGIEVFEIAEDDLAVEGFELVDPVGEAGGVDALVRVVVGGELVQVEEFGLVAALAEDVGDGDVVDPGSERAAVVGIELVGTGEAVEGGAEFIWRAISMGG